MDDDYLFLLALEDEVDSSGGFEMLSSSAMAVRAQTAD